MKYLNILSGDIFIFLVFLGGISGHRTTETMYMSDYCDLSIYMSGSILLDLTSASQYQPNWQCIVNINTLEVYEDRIMLKFRWMDIESSLNCQYDRLIIYDGIDTSYPKLSGRYGLCGFDTPRTIYRSSGEWLTFNFTSDDSLQRKGFEVLITAFDDTGVCDSSEFLCGNGYCIDDFLQCDGYDNCGDDSDEVEGCTLSMTAIVGITIGSIAGLFLVAAVVIGIARSRRTVTSIQHASTERSYLTQSHNQHPPVYPIQPPSYVHSQNDLPPSYNTVVTRPAPYATDLAPSYNTVVTPPAPYATVPTISAQLTNPVENK